jgi:hypothetical protein
VMLFNNIITQIMPFFRVRGDNGPNVHER